MRGQRQTFVDVDDREVAPVARPDAHAQVVLLLPDGPLVIQLARVEHPDHEGPTPEAPVRRRAPDVVPIDIRFRLEQLPRLHALARDASQNRQGRGADKKSSC